MGQTSSSIRGILGIQDPIEVVAFRAAPVGVVVCDAEGTIFMSNREAEHMLNSPYPLQGASVHQFVNNPDHKELVKQFVESPSAAKRHVMDARPVKAQTLDGESIDLIIRLSHTMYDGVKLAIAAIARPCGADQR